ncbi:hypothetical protein Tco_0248102 [Tanacetum coccineum]
MFEEEQAQFEREQRIARERAVEQETKDATLIEQMEDIQARMDADELLVERLQQEEREQFTIKEKSRMLVEMIAERKRFFAAQRTKQIRNKPPTRAQLRNKMKLYEKEQKWINDFVPIDSEVVKDNRKDKAAGSRKKTNARKRASEKLDDESVKRQKIEDDAEKEELRAYLDIIPGDNEAINDDDIWKAQKDYKLISWRLFDSCGVHVLLMDTGIAIHMMVEKKYPLTQEMLSRMLNRRLEVDHETNPTDPRHTPTITQSSTQPQKTQILRKPKRKDTQVPQPSVPSKNVADRAVHKELGNSLVRATTIASSLEAEQDSGGGPRCQETMGILLIKLGCRKCILNIPNYFMLEEMKEFFPGFNMFKDDVDNEMFDVNVLNGEEVFVAGQNENIVEEVVDATQVSTAATTQSQDKGKGIMIEEPVKPMKKKVQIMLDEEAALKLQAEFDEEERLAREKAKKEKEANIALIKE